MENHNNIMTTNGNTVVQGIFCMDSAVNIIRKRRMHVIILKDYQIIEIRNISKTHEVSFDRDARCVSDHDKCLNSSGNTTTFNSLALE